MIFAADGARRCRQGVKVAAVKGPLAFLAASNFLADEVGERLPLQTGPGRTALFLASLLFPGSLPNPFADTRWEPRVYAAYDSQGRIVGLVQTALANVAQPELRTVRFLQNMVVAARWRRRGVASALLELVISADNRFDAALCVEPNNEAAVQLYARFGFELDASQAEREGMRLMLRVGGRGEGGG